MKKKSLYVWNRDLHYYSGLFLCPFLVIFAASTIALNHSWKPNSVESDPRTVPVEVPAGLAGEPLARNLVEQLGLQGELGFFPRQSFGKDNPFTISVVKPGLRHEIVVNRKTGNAEIRKLKTESGKRTTSVDLPAGLVGMPLAQHLAGQLDLQGKLGFPPPRNPPQNFGKNNPLKLSVVKPGLRHEVEVDKTTGTAEIKEFETETASVEVPEGLEDEPLARRLAEQLELQGEVGLLPLPLGMNVGKPGLRYQIEVDRITNTAEVKEFRSSLMTTMKDLHFNPGPHRGGGWDWIFYKIWAWLADTAVYLLLFSTISGIYIWTAFKSERKIGLIILGAGVVSFLAIFITIL